ncbi:MAG: A/G-specific adenine glycosylase [Candidatus Krumholzibacteriia bacterium]
MTGSDSTGRLSPCRGLDFPALRRDLLAWFDRNGRDLPWRRGRTPYRTWISEIMLQQTTVAAVRPYFLAFLERFPDPAALAAASEDEVLALWSGLGYYRRARLLHQAAGVVVRERGGVLPDSAEEWASLPGIGDYAAGAIASMALGERVPAVDANARRVLLRWVCAEPLEADGISPRDLRALSEELVDEDRPGDWNEAIMDLGSSFCTARSPRCRECPVLGHCRAGQGGRADQVPAAASRPGSIRIMLAALVLRAGDAVLLVPSGAPPAGMAPRGAEVFRSDFSSLNRGFRGPPTTAWFREDEKVAWDPAQVWGPYLASLGLPPIPAGTFAAAGTVTHTITRHRLGIRVHVLDLPTLGDHDPEDAKKDLTGALFPVYAGSRVRGVGRQGDPATPPLSRMAAKILACGIKAGG